MNYIKGFVPWIAFSALSSVVGWQWGALVALAATGWAILRDRRSGVTVDAQILDLGSAVYFAALTAVAFAAPHSVLEQYDGALSSVWLAAIAWFSLAVRQPFTEGIARRQTPREYWGTAAFRKVNTTVTLVWTASFTATAFAAFACDALDAPTLVRVAYQAVGCGVPAYFTHRYVARVRAARAALEVQTAIPAVA
ncbi:hypothetical protein [Tsukamurella soli]|uniref:Intracellular septation protein A n=1 Tax=Tsukamurella soli TaxID=644556 RepID=A0ABP8JJV8_9ACTN